MTLTLLEMSSLSVVIHRKQTDRQTVHDTYFDRNVPTVSGDTEKTTDRQCMTLTLLKMSSLSVMIQRKQQTDNA